jgi:hypothetical protein
LAGIDTPRVARHETTVEHEQQMAFIGKDSR